MKLINFIVNPANGILTEVLKRKAKRIQRNIEQAIETCEDEIDELKEQNVVTLKSLGEVAEASSTGKMADILSKICTNEEKIAQKNRCIEYLKKVRAELDKEVDVTTNPVHVKEVK